MAAITTRPRSERRASLAGRARPTRSAAAIQVRGLTKRYGRRLAVDGATFEVPRGVVAGFVGPNGAGKTTTMRMLLGLVHPSGGEGNVLGRPISQPAAYMPQVGALIEGPAFYGSLSGRENLEVLTKLGSIPRSRIDAVLEIVGLQDRRDDQFRAYSLGMKQRLGIAAALLREPELLMLDEPTNGLDPAGIHDMRELIRRIATEGPTVFLSSHLLTEVESVCEYLVMVDRGRLLYQGTTQGLLASATESLLIGAETAEQLERVAAIAQAGGHRVEREDGHVRVHAPRSAIAELSRALAEQGVVITELVPVRTSLEDRFLELTGERQ